MSSSCYFLLLTHIACTMVALVVAVGRLTMRYVVQYCRDVLVVWRVLTAVYLREYHRQ